MASAVKMLSGDDQLCLNISSDLPSSRSYRKKPQNSQQRWVKKKKKQQVEKRKSSSTPSEEKGHTLKQRRLQQTDTAEKEEEETATPPSPPPSPPPPPAKASPLKLVEKTTPRKTVATLSKVLNVDKLTSVQKQTIPALLSGRDAVVRSQIGSGKTLSYAVPLVQNLQAVEPKVSRSDGPLAVIIVPTRELALQTFQTLQKLLKPFTWIVSGVLMGGEKRKSEKARLRKGINILVSTPGRLVDHIKNTLSIAFSAVRWLILDDRILDLGFEKDLSVILNSLNKTGPSRQNVLLSATMKQGVTQLADVCLNDPVSIHVSGSSDPDSVPAATSDPGLAAPSESFAVPEALRQFVVVVPSKICLFSQNNKVIIFISSCEAVEFLHSLFTSVLAVDSAQQKSKTTFLRLHGNMKQEERSEVFQQFSVSQSGVLLCTDVAARGLDLPQVTWIVQYTSPTTAAEYVHRVGRTARIGEKGNSLLFLTPAETAFITELANHNISLSEMKLLSILSSLMLDDAYKGRGKYHSKVLSQAEGGQSAQSSPAGWTTKTPRRKGRRR